MRYYEVHVASKKYHGAEALTYSGPEGLKPGTVVEVDLRGLQTLGIIFQRVSKPKFTTNKLRVLGPLIALPPRTFQMLNWLAGYYPAPLGSITSLFLPPSLSQKKPPADTPKTKRGVPSLPTLTTEQKTALATISKDRHSTFMLHGETGSGKTRLYLELAKKQLEAGKQCLILTPEIGLTSQLFRQFDEQFPERVVVFHSNLTAARRRDTWLQILHPERSLIIIGPRSALFLPFKNLGLVVVDEAHEPAYKQEQAPRYNALRVASFLAKQYGARLIFGSGTPLVSEMYIARSRHIPVLRMRENAVESTFTTKVARIQLRDRSKFTRDPYLSDVLLDELDKTLAGKEQALIYLNRRGTARAILCQACGWRASCPRCALPLTYHGDQHLLRCHTCGFNQSMPVNCPVCNSSDIIFKTLGTKALAALLQKKYPKVRIQRFDTDNLTAERLEAHVERLQKGEVDILIGTQLLAKGLDLPLLRLVAVVQADLSLQLPDYTSEERTYQLLSQVIGRMGRGHRAGVAVIQSYNPENPALEAAVSKNYDAFYESQLLTRKQHLFPPFCFLLKLTATRKSPDAARQATLSLKATLAKLHLKIEVIGPSPGFYEQFGSGYHWQLVVKTSERKNLLKIIAVLPSGWTYDLDPATLL